MHISYIAKYIYKVIFSRLLGAQSTILSKHMRDLTVITDKLVYYSYPRSVYRRPMLSVRLPFWPIRVTDSDLGLDLSSHNKHVNAFSRPSVNKDATTFWGTQQKKGTVVGVLSFFIWPYLIQY